MQNEANFASHRLARSSADNGNVLRKLLPGSVFRQSVHPNCFIAPPIGWNFRSTTERIS